MIIVLSLLLILILVLTTSHCVSEETSEANAITHIPHVATTWAPITCWPLGIPSTSHMKTYVFNHCFKTWRICRTRSPDNPPTVSVLFHERTNQDTLPSEVLFFVSGLPKTGLGREPRCYNKSNETPTFKLMLVSQKLAGVGSTV